MNNPFKYLLNLGVVRSRRHPAYQDVDVHGAFVKFPTEPSTTPKPVFYFGGRGIDRGRVRVHLAKRLYLVSPPTDRSAITIADRYQHLQVNQVYQRLNIFFSFKN